MTVPQYWCPAEACQIAWCFAFRPSLDTPQLLWISAVCLTGMASDMPQMTTREGDEHIGKVGGINVGKAMFTTHTLW